MKDLHPELLATARNILKENSRSGFTIPAKGLYPFQWNWDSGFVGIGLANYDVEAAIREIRSLLSGQWANGMIPHIVFHSEVEKTYFPNRDFWDSHINAGAPARPKTSGITQPPVLGFALEEMYRKNPSHKGMADLVRKAYPSIVKYHEYWYTHRDPQREGLVFIYHPWESGRDNSPIWDTSLDLIDLEQADIPDYRRRDIAIADADQRPTDLQYDQYIYLLQLGKRHRYEGPGIAEESEFLIQDSLVNAMLIRSNQGLIRLGEQFGYDVGLIREWQQQSIRAFDRKLWCDPLQTYAAYDLRRHTQIPLWEIGGLTALYAGIPSVDRAARMVSRLGGMLEGYRAVPSFDAGHALFDPKRYWRGPVWPQMNWLIYRGLKEYGFAGLASQVRQDILDLVGKYGFHEYFDSRKSLPEEAQGGYGGDRFSWTAAMVIDLVMDP